MTGCIFSYCCAMIILLLGRDTSGFSHEKELYEGSQCKTEHGEAGVCKKLPECPPKLADALAGRRGGDAAGRCGFDSYIEIVCCPLKLKEKIHIRPSEIACQEFANEITNEITSEINDVDRDEEPPTASRLGGGTKVNPFIFSGTRAAAGEFPYMAALGYLNTDDEESDPIVYDCGGALISSRYILTAAHCVSNVNNRVPRWVRLGSESIRSEDAQEIPVERAIAHPRYRRSQNYYDIALVELKVEVRISTRIKPVCLQTLALQNTSINSRTSFVAIGFGATSLDELRSDQLMKSAELNLVPVSLCNESYVDFGKLPLGIDNTMICAVDANSTRGSDACQGDSGGPLLMITETAATVLGVTSFGQSCGTVVPGVYTSVYSHIDWIESKVWPEKTKS